MSLLKTYTYIDQDKYSDEVAKFYARVIFYGGVIGSFLDGMTTWYVLTQVHTGVEVEKNGLMARLMHEMGIGLTCSLRVLIGVIFFWFMSRETLGSRYFFTKRSKDRFIRSLSKDRRSVIFRWVHERRSYIYPLQAMIGLLATWAVVGNNLNAIYISMHSSL